MWPEPTVEQVEIQEYGRLAFRQKLHRHAMACGDKSAQREVGQTRELRQCNVISVEPAHAVLFDPFNRATIADRNSPGL